MYMRYLILIAAGFFGGFFGSAVGSAGLVSLPVMLFFGLSPHAAIGTTRPAAVVLEIFSAARYWKEGVLTPALLRKGLLLGIAGGIGSSIGAMLIASASDQTLRLLLVLVISTMTIFVFAKRKWGMREIPERQKKVVLLGVATLLGGLYGGLFGFTFGTLINLILAGFGYTLLQCAGMGRVIGAITSTMSAIVFAWQGYLHIPYAIALSVGFGIGGWAGAGVAAKMGNRYIRVLLIAVVVCSVAKLLFDYVSAVQS